MSSDFAKVAQVNEIEPGQMKAVNYNNETVCIANVDGQYYAIDNICSHEQGPLADGTIENFEVECPWHGARFDIRTGKVLSPPAETDLARYEVKIEGNDILVRKAK